MRHVRIHITGIVQGVGFRPFVYREAAARDIAGWVMNAADGVHIEAHAQPELIDAFIDALSAHAPAAARIDGVQVTELVPGQLPDQARASGFSIIASDDAGARTTLVSPDIATCPDCLNELFDPADRRYHYPFINCTNCGPRYTIIRALPYDRAATSMAAFPMCPDCAAEYADPLNRRFHAQPDACFACGPHITWREASSAPVVGTTRETSDAIIERCAQLLLEGGIVAIKGLGGFHLACNAEDDTAVRALRHRKRRSNKPLAVMMASLSAARSVCHVDDSEAALLSGTIRPIVLLHRADGAGCGVSADAGDTAGAGATVTAGAPHLAPAVAGDLPELGVMLPYTPLQHLLMAQCAQRGISALVMTSGNISGEPIEIDDDLAWDHLVASGIADALLGNDRAILSRFDDSVVRVTGNVCHPVRRARGYAPRPLDLPPAGVPSPSAASGQAGQLPAVLVCGPEQKATIAFTRERTDGSAACFVSQHIGDLEHASTLDAWHEVRIRMQDLFGITPSALACDLHPGYLSSQWARAEAQRAHLPLIEVQHHHAHIASVIAEVAARGELEPDAAVIGIALDGTGAGTDGTVWGGEVLVATLEGFRRIAHLAPWPLPGGTASVRDARRCAFALLAARGLVEHPGAARLMASLTEAERSLTASMIERGLNCPKTSSMGRFLDALAAVLGVCERATYEGEPAIELEARAASLASERRGEFMALGVLMADQADIGQEGAEPFIIDVCGMLSTLLDRLASGADVAGLAFATHVAVARVFAHAAAQASRAAGITDVALSGGCFMNRPLLDMVQQQLRSFGLHPLVAHEVPVNDGCIAYGQAAVARARLAAKRPADCAPHESR